MTSTDPTARWSAARRTRASLALVAIAILAALLLAEVGLRAAGVGPWTPFAALADVPVMTDPDPELGWRPRPGVYRWQPDPDAPPVTLTLGDDGGRGPNPEASTWIFGGSFALGFGVHDTDHLAARLPDARSHGVPGYGTLQSWRRYRQLRSTSAAPDTVIYGLVDLHDARNACTRSWLHTLDRAPRHHPHVRCPWAMVEDGALVEHPPRTGSHWPVSEHIALIVLVERVTIDLLDRPLNRKTETTVQLVRAFRDEVEADGARFVTALLWAPSRRRAYTTRLAEEGVDVVDLTDLGYPDGDTAVPVDGHPSAALHARWAARLSAHLRRS